MRIEELYDRPNKKYPPVRLKTTRHSTMATTRKRSDFKDQPRPLPTAEKRKIRRRSTMRIEQVARHEETSYLLDSETNQAILKNVVAKDEICQFLTPLKFIEIDTWRKEVPYGLTKETGVEKRKWRTPLEILEAVSRQDNVGEHDVIGKANPLRTGSAEKLLRRQGLFSAPVRSALTQRRSTAASRSQEKEGSSTGIEKTRNSGSSGKEEVQLKSSSDNQRPPPPSGRPSTSPTRQPILSKINSERLLLMSKQRSFGANVETQKGYPSTDGVPGRLLYTKRTQMSSITPLRRSLNTPTSLSSLNLVIADVTKSAEENGKADGHLIYTGTTPSGGNFERIDSNARGQQGETIVALKNSTGKYENVLLRPPTRPRSSDKGGKLQGTYSDPNIAYGPQLVKKSQRTKRDGVNYKVRNYYAAAQSPNDVTVGDVSDVGKAKQPWTIKRETGTPSKSPNVTARIIYHAPETSQGHPSRAVTSRVHCSPWVTQALPDPALTVNDKLTKVAERDGYYVSRNSKSVTFSLGDKVPDSPFILRNSNGSSILHHPTKKHYISDKLSMVVVDVDKPHNSKLPRDGALTARMTSPANTPKGLSPRTGFSDVLHHSHSIPVRP